MPSELLRHAAESLAGRVAFHELDGLALDEIAPAAGTADWLDTRWVRGGFPRALLGKDLAASRAWREAFIRTYLERDLPQLGINLPAITLRRFWTMLAHPKCGASWEGFMLHEVIRRTRAQRGEAFFWSVHTGAELDLLILRGRQRLGFEFKLTGSPRVTPSMRSSREVLVLDHLYVICHAEGEPWPLAEGITALPAACLASPQWQPLRD